MGKAKEKHKTVRPPIKSKKITKSGTPRKNKPGAGRPKLDLDVDLIENMAATGLTVQDISTILEVSKDTLERNYAANIEKGRAKCRMSLQKKQYEVAMQGDKTMLIWLGKIRCAQKETVINEHTGRGGGPIEVAPPLSEEERRELQELEQKALTSK